jgi:two-component system NarL family sensor kinase
MKTNFDELEKRNHELSILSTIAKELNRSVDLDKALHTVLAQVAELLNLETGWIWLLHEDTGESYMAASQNLPAALVDNPRLMEGGCYCLNTYRAGDLKGAANVNVVTCSRLKGLVEGTDGLRNHASIPLYAQEKKLGVLNVASTTWKELSPEELRLLNTAGDLLSIAIERAQFFEKIQEAKLRVIEEMGKELQVAHTVQMELLPETPPQIEGMELSGVCIPANHVGGGLLQFSLSG